MTTALPAALRQFQWQPQPGAQAIIDRLVREGLARCAAGAELASRMKSRTGTRFADWLDHIAVGGDDSLAAELIDAGFESRPAPGAPECFRHEGGMFPEIVLGGPARLAIKVESVADFGAAWGLDGWGGGRGGVIGGPGSRLRMAPAFDGDGVQLWVVERHGWQGYEPPPDDSAERALLAAGHLEALRARRRDFEDDGAGFERAGSLLDAAIADLERDQACDLFFAAEREYWQRRNRAARVQKERQDGLGLGWANHDHHTYRSSRRAFTALVALWEKLGFLCRERFYAGAEAGWGAQVMEQPATGIITFNDVDLSPEELLADFAHEPLAERAELGTVGLWCALHGEAVLQAGMHHLEAQFDWHALKEQLESAGVRTMDPFTAFDHLRQAFTEGERWPVGERRIGALLERAQITPEQAAQFRAHGAIGSHLENLERNDGFKGFNQSGVSDIIARTDPRRQPAPGAVGA